MENQTQLDLSPSPPPPKPARKARFDVKERRVDFISPPPEERHSKIDKREIARRVFILLVVVAIMLSIWYLLSSIVFKPIKDIIQEEMGKVEVSDDIIHVDNNKVVGIKSNMSTLFSNAISDLNITAKSGDDQQSGSTKSPFDP